MFFRSEQMKLKVEFKVTPAPSKVAELVQNRFDVLAAGLSYTEQRAAQIGRAVFNVPGWYDIDDAASLNMLRDEFLGRPVPVRVSGTVGQRTRTDQRNAGHRHRRGSEKRRHCQRRPS